MAAREEQKERQELENLPVEIRVLEYVNRIAVYNYVRRLKIKHKRDIFASVREFNADEKCLLVSFGITTGEFCLFDVLNSSK